MSVFRKKIYSAIEAFLYLPVFPVLFSIYSVFVLYAYNVHGFPFTDLIRPLVLAIFFSLFLYWGLLFLFRCTLTAALGTMVLLFSFFQYGHVRNLLYDGDVLLETKKLALLWSIMMLAILFGVLFFSRKLKNGIIVPALNLMTIVLLLFPVVRLAVYSVARAIPLDRNMPEKVLLKEVPHQPDIYYIILDSYTRSDVVKSVYEYDNKAFLDELRDMGFYVAECSQSNYGLTALSLSSSLNLDYIQNISNVFHPSQTDLLPAFNLLDSNIVRNSLTDSGYKIVAFPSGFYWAEWRDADLFVNPPSQPLSEFEIVVLFSSYARLLDDFDIIDFDELYYEHYRSRTRLVLDSFEELLKIPSPKFVFIHLIIPHEPFAFDKDGNAAPPFAVDANSGYAGQAEYISNALVPELQKLLDEASNPPVIILQGDHGRLGDSPKNSLKILNAYYLPGDAEQFLYPTISPVNTFRVVFNSYFGTDYPLLEDVSYYSDLSHKYAFTVIPNECP